MDEMAGVDSKSKGESAFRFGFRTKFGVCVWERWAVVDGEDEDEDNEGAGGS